MLDFLPRWWRSEPVRFWSALVVLINSVIALAVELDWLQLEASAVSLLYLVVLNGAVLLGGEAVRQRVTPTGDGPADPPEVPPDP